MFGGAVIGGGVAYLITRNGNIVSFAAIGGISLATGIMLKLHQRLPSEKHVRKISSLDEYICGNNVRTLLHQEYFHANEVAIQRALYAALLQEKYNLTPEQFLTHVYNALPHLGERTEAVELKQTPSQLSLEERLGFNQMLVSAGILLEKSPQPA